MSQWFSDFSLTRLPGERREMGDVVRLSTVTSRGLETEGLPTAFTGYFVDGIGYRPARHPVITTPGLETAAFPVSAFDGVELLTNGADVEWSGVGGGMLSGHTWRGGRKLALRTFADWTGDALSQSDFYDGDPPSYNTLRGGLLLSGPVFADSAHFVLGAEARRVQMPMSPAWVPGPLDTALLAEADTSFGVDLSGYLTPRVVESEVISGFGRFDWQVAAAHRFSVRSSFATISVDNFDPGMGFTASIGSKMDGTDISAGATLTSRLSQGLSAELRIGVENSRREYFGAESPATVVVAGGQAFGNDPALGGRFERIAVRGRETVHIAAGPHAFKVGVEVTGASLDQTYNHGQGGEFFFSGPDQMRATEGVFVQSVGTFPVANYSTLQFGAFLQDRWRVAPGFELTVGLRYELEDVPVGEVQLNSEWLNQTGLSNIDVDGTRGKFSPRLGFLVRRGQWLVRGETGIYYDVVDPAVFSEYIIESGGMRVRRGVGVLGAWPGAPDLTAAPVAGERLTLLPSKLEAPRSSRVSFGISRVLGTSMSFHVSGTYRHTSFLPRRQNLNRHLAPIAFDQYERALQGTLIQQGALLAAVPESNRRFTDFDLVSSLDLDGVSEYWGATVAFERQLEEIVKLSGSYTYSKTDDNWLGAIRNGGAPDDQLSPFPYRLQGRDWADGRSDFDVPHWVVAGLELGKQRGLGVRLAGFYRYRSGYPFTPGFRDGVDANGDGSARNDPAFIDDEIDGVADLLSQWDCLRSQVGRFAQRNSCRSPGVHTLDVRVGIGFFQSGGFRSELVLDALNLLESEVEIPDRAVYLIDESGALATDPVSGNVTVPLVANPNFGLPLAHRASGRMVRFGLRMEF
jgi:hypothetical protein